MGRQVFTTEGPSRPVENIIVILTILKEAFQLFFIPITYCNFVIIVFPSGGGIGHSIVKCGKEPENCEKIDHPQYMWISFMVIAQVGIYETLSFILKPNLFF